MSAKENPQTAMDEREIASGDLERTLEKRQTLKEAVAEARKEYREADEAAKTMLAEFALADGEVARCGRFRIEKKAVPPRSVSFETAPTSRLRIDVREG